MLCTPRCMSFYPKHPFVDERGEMLDGLHSNEYMFVPKHTHLSTEKGELTDRVRPNVHEFLPQSKYLCTQRLI